MSDLDCDIDCGYCIVACCEGCVEGCAQGCGYACCQCCLEAGCAACVAGCDEGSCCVAISALAILAAVAAAVTLLVVALVVVRPVGVAVEEASLTRLSLLSTTGNATAALLAYDVSLAVAVRNRNWLIGAEHAAPLDAELLFGRQRFARVRMVGGAGGRIRGGKGELYHVAAAGESADVALGSDGVAEFVRESVSVVFWLELRLFGEVKYPPHRHARRLQVSCLLELSLSSATAPVAFTKVKCV